MMIFPELNWSAGGLPQTDPFAAPMAVPPTSLADPFGDPSMANMNVDPYTVPPQSNAGSTLLGGAGGGFDQNSFLKALGGVKMPAAPAPQAPPRAPDAPKAGAIPGGLQQLLAMLGGGGATQIPGMRL